MDTHNKRLLHLLSEFTNFAYVVRQGLEDYSYVSAETQGQTLIAYITAQADLTEQLLITLNAIIDASIEGSSDLDRRLDCFYTSLVNACTIEELTLEIYKHAKN